MLRTLEPEIKVENKNAEADFKNPCSYKMKSVYLHVFYFFSSFHSPPFFLIFIFFFLRRSVRPSIPRSVGLSVHPLRLCKYRVSRLYLATFRSYTNSNARRTCFQSLFCPFVVHLSVRLSVSPYSCHVVSAKFNIRGDTVRTHRCPVGLVPFGIIASERLVTSRTKIGSDQWCRS